MSGAWRQGDLFPSELALKLQLLSEDEVASHWVVVISHSCDIARDVVDEPVVEVLIARVVDPAKADSRNGHSIRKLHLPAVSGDQTMWLELQISQRSSVPKPDLIGAEPSDTCVPQSERAILRRWLAQRYSRSEFPDAFINWLRESGIDSQFEKIGKKYSGALAGIYFDLDDDAERTDPSDPYELGIYLVYASEDAGHAEKANEAARKLNELFSNKCLPNGEWKWFELLYCEEASDQAFSLRAANEYQRWRFEHRSIKGEPLDESND